MSLCSGAGVRLVFMQYVLHFYLYIDVLLNKLHFALLNFCGIQEERKIFFNISHPAPRSTIYDRQKQYFIDYSTYILPKLQKNVPKK